MNIIMRDICIIFIARHNFKTHVLHFSHEFQVLKEMQL